MTMSAKRTFIAVLALVMIIGLSGCGKKKVKVIEKEPEKIEREKWDDSVAPEDRVYQIVDELETVYFDFDKALVKKEAKEILETNAQWLKDNPYEWVRIEGHCDERGTEEYNIALGERRAESVRKYYIAMGIDSSRIATLSWGEEKPADPRNNEAAWSRNRRAETLLRMK